MTTSSAHDAGADAREAGAQSRGGRPNLVVASSVRRRVLDQLVPLGPGAEGEPRPGLSAAEIGERLGLHVTTARFHLDRLIEAGVVEGFTESRGTVGRPRKLYAARADALPAGRLDAPFRELSDILSELWSSAREGQEIDAALAGYQWALAHPLDVEATARARTVGAWLVKVEQVVQVVARWGNTGSLTLLDGGQAVEVRLASCPFAAVARHRPDIVRELHRGIITGVLSRIGEPDVEVSFAPMGDDEACVGVLRTRTPLSMPVGGRVTSVRAVEA